MKIDLKKLSESINKISNSKIEDIHEIIGILNDISYFVEDISDKLNDLQSSIIENIKEDLQNGITEYVKEDLQNWITNEVKEDLQNSVIDNLKFSLGDNIIDQIPSIDGIIDELINKKIDIAVEIKLSEKLKEYDAFPYNFMEISNEGFFKQFYYDSGKAIFYDITQEDVLEDYGDDSNLFSDELENRIEYLNQHTEMLLDYNIELLNEHADELQSEIFSEYNATLISIHANQIKESILDEIKLGLTNYDPFEDILHELENTFFNSNRNIKGFENRWPYTKTAEKVYEEILNSGYFIEIDKIRDIENALKNNRLVVFEGPPGSGKTQLAKLISSYYNLDDSGFSYELVDKSWSKATSYGGPTMKNNTMGSTFGKITQVIFKNINNSKIKWLILDEWNRGDIEKYLGCFLNILDIYQNSFEFSFISHNSTKNWKVNFPNSFRIIATMNSYEKDGLFSIPENILRRIAIIPIDKLSPELENSLILKEFEKYKKELAGKKHNKEFNNLYENLHKIIKKIQNVPAEENDWIYRDCFISSALKIKIIRESINLFFQKINTKIIANTDIFNVLDKTFSQSYVAQLKSTQPVVYSHLIENVFVKESFPHTNLLLVTMKGRIRFF